MAQRAVFGLSLFIVPWLGSLSCTPATDHKADVACVDPPAPGCSRQGLSLADAANPLTADPACITGFMADGVCCNTACDGVCQGCVASLTGKPSGLCAPILNGANPHNACPGTSTCDGKGGCWHTAQGAACLQDYECDSGHCVDGSCCNTACNSACQTCSDPRHPGQCLSIRNGEDPATCNVDMAGGACPQAPCKCDGSSVCRPSLVATCHLDADCQSGVCRDGVCCGGACGGACVSCNGAHTGQPSGQCAAVLDGYDPAGACGSAACNGQGACYGSELGIACNQDYECKSGECADGVCCASECLGACHACRQDLTGQPSGVCGPVKTGTDPRNDCLGALSCNGQGTCTSKEGGDTCSRNEDCRSKVCCGNKCTYGWQTMPSGTTETLNRIAGSDAKHLVAVGNYGTVVQYDGISWTTTSPVTRENLDGVAMRGDHIMAVGRRGGILRADGGRWQNTPSPTTAALRDVRIDSGTSAYALGDDGVVHVTDAGATLVRAPDNVRFGALAKLEGELIALGRAANGDGRAFKIRNRAWASLDMPFRDTRRAAVFRLDLVVAGPAKSGAPLGRLHHGTWSVMPYPGGYVVDLWSNDTALFALTQTASTTGDRQDIVSYNGQTWSTEWRSDGGVWLTDLWGASSCELFAVGNNGIIVRR